MKENFFNKTKEKINELKESYSVYKANKRYNSKEFKEFAKKQSEILQILSKNTLILDNDKKAFNEKAYSSKNLLELIALESSLQKFIDKLQIDNNLREEESKNQKKIDFYKSQGYYEAILEKEKNNIFNQYPLLQYIDLNLFGNYIKKQDSIMNSLEPSTLKNPLSASDTLISQSNVAYASLYDPLNKNDINKVLKKITRFGDGVFLTFNYLATEKFIFRNPIISKFLSHKEEDAFLDFTLNLNNKNNNEEDLTEKLHKANAKVEGLISDYIKASLLREIFGGSVYFLCYEDEKNEDMNKELKFRENENLLLKSFNRWENVSFKECYKKGIENSLSNNINYQDLQEALFDYFTQNNSPQEELKAIEFTYDKDIFIFGIKVHKSRQPTVLKTDYAISTYTRSLNLNWGLSALDVHQNAIANLLTGLQSVEWYIQNKSVSVFKTPNALSNESNFIKSEAESATNVDNKIILGNGTSLERSESQVNVYELFRTVILVFCAKTNSNQKYFLPEEGSSSLGQGTAVNEQERLWKREINKIRIKNSKYIYKLVEIVSQEVFGDKNALNITFESKIEQTFDQKTLQSTAILNAISQLSSLGESIDIKATVKALFPEIVFNEDENFSENEESNKINLEELKSEVIKYINNKQ
jgi:hypothetical protein